MKQLVEQYQVEGNVGGQRVAMGISQEAQSIVMNILSDMYSNRPLAMVREYSTNAHDAHVEAGQTRPIEVTLPSALSPFLRIRDFGVGLTVDGIHNIYSQYGASTKRDSNDQNGTFGIGCKAALAYCSQFTVTSVKDGTKIVVTVGRDETGGGSMTIVDTLASNEPNGTEVMIPVARGDIDRVIDEAESFYRFWAPDTVLVNGKPPKRFEGFKLTDDLFVMENEPTSLIVMGNVPYPAPQLDSLVPSASVLAFVPIGAVNIPPPRESLMDTKTTRATIELLRATFKSAAVGAIQREIDAAETPHAAIQIVVKWSRYLAASADPSGFQYKGTNLPSIMRAPAYDPVVAPYKQPEAALMPVAAVNDYRAGYSRNEIGWPVASWPTTVWVENWTPAKFTAQHKRKMLKWCVEQGLDMSHWTGVVTHFVMLRDKLPSVDFIDPARIVDWEDVRKIKLEVKPRYNGSTRIPGSYDIYTEDGFKSGVPGDDLRQNYPIFYHRGNHWETSPMNDAIQVYHKKYTLVCLPQNRVDKFQRILPSAKLVMTAIIDQFDAWAKTVTVDQRKALAMGPNARKALAQMDAGKIDDPALQGAIRIAKIDVEKIKDARQTFKRYVDVSSLDITWASPLDAYPLFNYKGYTSATELLRTDPQHIYTYFNAAYAAR